MTNTALRGKPDAGNPHVRFDEGEVASAATPRRGSLLYKYHRYNSIGCSGVIAFFIGLIVTAILLCVSIPLIKSFGADAGKLIFLTVGILAAVGFFYCWRQYDDTLVMIKWMWWEFLMAICFWIAFAFTVFYFKVDDLFNADGTSKDQNIETLK